MVNVIVPKTGFTLLHGANSIKNAVMFAGGSPAEWTFLSIRAAANINLFATEFKDGATALDEINWFGQFRGYPSYKVIIFDLALPNLPLSQPAPMQSGPPDQILGAIAMNSEFGNSWNVAYHGVDLNLITIEADSSPYSGVQKVGTGPTIIAGVRTYRTIINLELARSQSANRNFGVTYSVHNHYPGYQSYWSGATMSMKYAASMADAIDGTVSYDNYVDVVNLSTASAQHGSAYSGVMWF